MRILFIGSVEFSNSVLSHMIVNNANIVGVVTKQLPLNPSDHMDLSEIAETYKIPWCYARDVNSVTSINWIKERNPDVIFCIGWPNLIKDELLSLTRIGVIGFHPTALPSNRGRHPIIWTLALGLKSTASTFFLMDNGVDSGPIISQEYLEVGDADTARDLYNKIKSIALKQVIEVVKKLETRSYENELKTTIPGNKWRKRTEVDGLIDWRMSSIQIYNLVRALSEPYPGAHILLGNSKIIIREVSIVELGHNNIEPGKVISSGTFGPVVKCGDGAVCLVSLDPDISIQEGMYL
jgi:methionyl-tRNA formyltransferase